jgi:hypothetical protein
MFVIVIVICITKQPLWLKKIFLLNKILHFFLFSCCVKILLLRLIV